MKYGADFISFGKMNPIKEYRLVPVREDSNVILQAFGKRFKSKVLALLKQMKIQKILINHNDDSITLPSGLKIRNALQVIKYFIYPAFFEMKMPKNYSKFLKALHQKQEIESEMGWIKIF